MPKWVKVVLAIVALLAGIVLLLFITARITGFGTTMNLVYFLLDYLKFIWNERLFA